MSRTGDTAGDEPKLDRCTLGWLVAQLGPRVAHLQCAPRGLDVPVRDPVIYDAMVAPTAEPGDLVLAIGIPAAGPDAPELIRWAASRDISAAAFKVGPDGFPERLVSAAEEAGVGLVGIEPEAAWDQLYTLVRRIMASAAALPSADDAVPVGDVFALANAIAAMVGGPVVINDPQLQVLAYSALDDPIDELRRLSILGRRPPEEMVRKLRDGGVLRKLLHSGEAIRLPEWTGDSPRIGVAIRAGKEALGFIFVAEGKAPLGDGALQTLLEASRIAALHLLRLQSSKDLERRLRSDLLRGVLEGRGSVDLLATRLGLQSTGAFTVVGFEFEPDSDEYDDGSEETDEEDVRLARNRVRDLVLVQSESLRRRAATASLGPVVYTLLPSSEPLSPDRLLALAHDVIDQAQRVHGVELLVGIGSTVTSLKEVAESRADADRVLRLLKTEGAGRRAASIHQLRAQAFLLEMSEVPALRPHVAQGKIAALVAHDGEHGTAYVETLRAFLDSGRDVVGTANLVHVHRNTLRYRIRRLCELVDLDLDDSTERLVAELHLRLLDPPRLPD